MTFDELMDFLKNRMRMSHIYQPLLIRSLVESGGMATIRQLAQCFVAQDESQIKYYERRIREMPVKVLKRHGVIEQQKELVSLNTGPLSFEQKTEIIMVCNQRMLEYMRKRGIAIWDYRLMETDPVPDSLRYQVLRDSGGRCCLCGATLYDRPLDVDHIIPRSRGGKNDIANLQVLCSKCNRSKRNLDATDFRGYGKFNADPACEFCSAEFRERAVERNESVFAVMDSHPVTAGHMLVVPFKHRPDYFSMTAMEKKQADELIMYLRNKTLQEDPTVAGFNIGANCGRVAGQSVMHAHIHLIPRREGDTPNPKGGVRGAVPDKMAY